MCILYSPAHVRRTFARLRARTHTHTHNTHTHTHTRTNTHRHTHTHTGREQQWLATEILAGSVPPCSSPPVAPRGCSFDSPCAIEACLSISCLCHMGMIMCVCARTCVFVCVSVCVCVCVYVCVYGGGHEGDERGHIHVYVHIHMYARSPFL